MAYWTEIYQRHFQSYFHKPFDIQVFNGPDNFSLKLAKYDLVSQSLHISGAAQMPKVQRRGLAKPNVFASIGLADKLIQKEEEDFGEVILVSDTPDPCVPVLLVNSLFFILQNGIALGSRFSIGGIDRMMPVFSKQFNKSALYFTLASDEREQFNKVRRGEEFGRVYQAYFITAEEDRYLADYGPDEFEKRFNELGDKRDQLHRPSCV